MSGRLRSLGLAGGLLQVVLLKLANVLGCEDDGLRGAPDGLAVLAVLDTATLERRKLDVVDRLPRRAAKGLVSWLGERGNLGKTHSLHCHWW